MKEDSHDKNIWKEKLDDLQLPPADELWLDMKSRLDEEMPVSKRRKWRGLWVIIFLLIAIVGIFTVTSKSDSKGSRPDSGLTSLKAGDDAAQVQHSRAQKKTKLAGSGGNTATADSHNLNDPQKTVTAPENPSLLTPLDKRSSAINDTAAQSGVALGPVELKPSRRNVGDMKVAGNKETQNGNNVHRNSSKPGADQARRLSSPPTSGNATGNSQLKSVMPSLRLQDAFGSNNNVSPDSLLKTLKTPDTVQSKEADQREKRKTRFALAVGVNHFFALGEQDKSRFNSRGESGTWSDYLPVPQVRVHHGSRLHAQLEMQFNTPQYTRQLVVSRVLGDSNQFGQRQQQTITLKKLFYFNAPVSLHYRLTEHLTVGAGVQYARLTNAVALQEDRKITANRPDTFAIGKIITIKGDSVYQRLRTNEVRFLLDASYSWKNFHAGVRYNHALTPFINYRISNTEITQARNNSLQLYVRYTLFEW